MAIIFLCLLCPNTPVAVVAGTCGRHTPSPSSRTSGDDGDDGTARVVERLLSRLPELIPSISHTPLKPGLSFALTLSPDRFCRSRFPVRA